MVCVSEFVPRVKTLQSFKMPKIGCFSVWKCPNTSAAGASVWEYRKDLLFACPYDKPDAANEWTNMSLSASGGVTGTTFVYNVGWHEWHRIDHCLEGH